MLPNGHVGPLALRPTIAEFWTEETTVVGNRQHAGFMSHDHDEDDAGLGMRWTASLLCTLDVDGTSGLKCISDQTDLSGIYIPQPRRKGTKDASFPSRPSG